MEKLVEALRRLIVLAIWMSVIFLLLIVNEESVSIIWATIMISPFAYENLQLDFDSEILIGSSLIIAIGVVAHIIVNWIFQKTSS
jgi:hypothetical protein